ncbi:Nicotianamine synthase [Parasponia andersonii]|uniref:Nicotianamine synthase n=1 Tax=Parasponia andersonii TaxID=3476 RepID=A0A2P5C6Z5_PARAD|nr:Nicotianamine synthase [Parasponia andersonii]
MASLHFSNLQIQIPADLLISHIIQLHTSISNLESLRPSKQVNALFTQLVNLCTLPSSIDVRVLPQELQLKRESLINLCGQAEGLLELEFSTFITKTPKPIDNLNLFPYYGNYVKLANLEYSILAENGVQSPKKVAFVGSGPLPLTSLVMAANHMKTTHFDNFDLDDKANCLARQMVASDGELEKRMQFVTKDVMEMRENLGEYDCIFLAALVGMSREEKVKILGHMKTYMKEEGFLLVRSANGARAFLYPVVEEHDLAGFEILSIFHPNDEVVNSVVLVRKPFF